jgi:glycosyltransferase involved in cell wall biosynthesis
MTRLSVIIPTRDGNGPLRACLDALVPSFPADAETIVVIDGGASDIESRGEDLVEPLRLRWIRIPRSGPAAARNRGLAAARGEIALFTDDDCRPAPGWVQALSAGVSASVPRAAGGRTLNGLRRNAYADAAQVVLDLVAHHERSTRGEEQFFPGNNCAFPIAPLQALGGFNEAYRTAEDRELCRRWRAAGYALDAIPSAVVEHDANTNLSAYLRKYFAYGRGAARFHRSGRAGSLGHAMGFHLRLPGLLGPELRRRGPWRGAQLVGLFLLWEAANAAGYFAEVAGGREPVALPSARESRLAE